MGDRAEVSHQLRMSDDHVQRLGRWEDGGLHSSPDNEHRAWTGALTPTAPHLRCGAACLCRWSARGGWDEGVPAAGGAASRVAGARAPTHARGLRRGRVHPARPGTCRCGRGRSTPSGTGFLSPYASGVPGWSGRYPAAWNVPAGGVGMVASGCCEGARPVPVLPGSGGEPLESPD